MPMALPNVIEILRKIKYIVSCSFSFDVIIGVLFWDEYKKQFLLQRGYNEKQQQQLAQNEQILTGHDEGKAILQCLRQALSFKNACSATNSTSQ